MANFLGPTTGIPNNGVVGTATNDNAQAGNIGETISSSVTSFANIGASGAWADITSVSLTAGDWMIYGEYNIAPNGNTTFTSEQIAVSTTSGNSSTGQTYGNNQFHTTAETTTGWGALANAPATTLVGYRVSLSGTTIHYLKVLGLYTGGGTPTAGGRITAVRIR